MIDGPDGPDGPDGGDAADPVGIARQLRALGVVEGDVVMVHASLRAVGPVVGGADGLLDALATAVGPSGTLLMPLGARDDLGWVNDRPEADRPGLLAGSEPFDARVTPADPEIGALAEVFRTRSGTVVSDHPEGRCGASGARAVELVVDVPWDDYHGPGSPLDRLVRAGGKVLRLGADLDTLTLLHLAEHRADVPGARRVRRHRLVTGPDGPVLVVVECLDDRDGIVDHPGEDYFAQILRAYLATGRAAVGPVGGAVAELLDGADVLAFGTAWMRAHLGVRSS